MSPRRRPASGLRLGALAATAALSLAACGPSSGKGGNSGTATTAPAHPRHGGIAEWADPPQATPNWIFPFMSLTYFSVSNSELFQYLLYRPLYFFGQITSAAPTVNYAQGPAVAPKWSNGGRTVTVTMKGWKWSDGETVSAQDVMFWQNMMEAERGNWAGYAPGPDNYPQNVKSYTANMSADTVTFNLNGTYNPKWYLYNELSQITPLPLAWDITAPGAKAGSGGCSSIHPDAKTILDCKKVWAFLTDDGGKAKSPKEAASLVTYASNPLWQVVDGPWRLFEFKTDGTAGFKPNRQYSGPKKPYLDEFIELPYTSDTSEYSALSSSPGTSGNLAVGYAPAQDLPTNSGRVGSVGANSALVSGKYNLFPVYDWGINYFPENFNSTAEVGGGTKAGYVFRQLYIRQALQSLVDQTAINRNVEKGYGVPTYGPVPIYPTNPFVSSTERANPYPFSISRARRLLSSHGWQVDPGGVSVCISSSKCGPGIHRGAKLQFSELYAGGTTAIDDTVTAEVSDWEKVGIKVSLKSTTFDNVIGTAVPCSFTSSSCSWEMGNWGGGWVYSPDYLPTGEEIFATGAGSNSGSYANSRNDRLIHLTNVSAKAKYFHEYENYLARQLPVIWQPNPAAELAEVSVHIGGVTPINALLNLTPEYWYFK
jgi:peptide/nickel transport system substrate-binding protein